jgi:hypothetical protein
MGQDLTIELLGFLQAGSLMMGQRLLQRLVDFENGCHVWWII